MPQDTQGLLVKALSIGDRIIAVVNRFTNFRSICDKLSNKVNSSQKVVRDLSAKYESHKDYFEQPSYNAAFNNYVTVMENCLNFLEAIENKALFVRLINGDKYKKTFYRLFIDIDQAVSVLNLGLTVKRELNQRVTAEALNSSQKEMAKIAGRGGFDDIIADSDQRDAIMEDIKKVQEDKLNTSDILQSAEIPPRQIKTIPGLLPRQGRRYTVFKRLYQGKVVAEKTLKDPVSDTKVLSDMRKQVAILKRLAVCPFIIQFIGVCIKGTKVGLVTQYADKGNLKDLLESTQRIDKELRYHFMVDVVEGVAFLHEMGVLHKNLKTSCILITDESKAKISGFEFSREMQDGTLLAVDEGSDRYRWIPPEKIQDYFEYTNKSDIYSLGMILWSIWSRRYPYEIMSQQAIEDLVSRGGREDIAQVPDEIRPIILGCWQQDPMDRPDASDIINELDHMSNQAGDSEIIPESMQDPWSDKKVLQAGEAIGVDVIFDDTASNKMDNLSLYDNDNLNAPSATAGSIAPSRFSNGDTRSINSRPNSYGSQENLPAPSAPMMPQTGHIEFPMPFGGNSMAPSNVHSSGVIQDFGSIATPIPTPSAAPLLINRNVRSNERRPEPNISINETKLGEFDDENFDIDLLSQPRENFFETRLGAYDNEDAEDLDLSLDVPVYTMEQALEFHNSKKRDLALVAFQQLSERNESKANYYLGYYYFWGEEGVVEKDWTKALHYFLLASEGGDSDAFDHLGLFYSNERNPEKSLVKAFEYYKKSAELGNMKGYYHLGVCYAKGRGTPINRELAVKNIKEAAIRGHKLAEEQLAKMAR